MFTDFAESEYFSEPESELNVPFVPTDEKIVEAMLTMGGVHANDLLYDLGSGDGRLVVAAARDRGARAVGIDMDPQRIEEATEYAGWTGVDHMVEFIEDDFLCADFSKATVVTLYLLNTVNLRLRPRLLGELRPGTRIISHAFDMGAWKPDEKLSAGGAKIYKWVVPAPVQGVWELSVADGSRYHVELNQEFQVVSGNAWIDRQPAQLKAAVLEGDRLELTIRKDDTAPSGTFTMRYADGQLMPVTGGKQNPAGLLVKRLEDLKAVSL